MTSQIPLPYTLIVLILEALLGAISLWVVLRWLKQSYRFADILLAFGGWILAGIIGAILLAILISTMRDMRINYSTAMSLSSVISQAAWIATGGYTTMVVLRRCGVEITRNMIKTVLLTWVAAICIVWLLNVVLLGRFEFYAGLFYTNIVSVIAILVGYMTLLSKLGEVSRIQQP